MLQIIINQTLLMTAGFVRINNGDHNCFWSMAGHVPQFQPENHVSHFKPVLPTRYLLPKNID